jgi:hypothetical protein
MAKRKIVLELEGTEDFELEVDYSAVNAPAQLSGPPEFCHPDESECEIVLPLDLKAQLTAYALDILVPGWIKSIKKQCSDLEFDGEPFRWERERKEDFDFMEDDR